MRNQVIPSGNVVAEYMSGNTTVRICDDYCRNRTSDEVEAILKGLAEKLRGPLIAAGVLKVTDQ